MVGGWVMGGDRGVPVPPARSPLIRAKVSAMMQSPSDAGRIGMGLDVPANPNSLQSCWFLSDKDGKKRSL